MLVPVRPTPRSKIAVSMCLCVHSRTCVPPRREEEEREQRKQGEERKGREGRGEKRKGGEGREGEGRGGERGTHSLPGLDHSHLLPQLLQKPSSWSSLFPPFPLTVYFQHRSS